MHIYTIGGIVYALEENHTQMTNNYSPNNIVRIALCGVVSGVLC